MSSITLAQNKSIVTIMLESMNNQGGKKKRALPGNAGNGFALGLQDIYRTQSSSEALMMTATTIRAQLQSSANSANFKQVLQDASAGQSTNQPAGQSGVEIEASESDESFVIDESTVEPGSQLEKNLGQAREIISKLRLTDDAWAVESLARDLAVFDLDFTAMKGNPHDTAQLVRDKSFEKLAELEERRYEPGFDFEKARREITGASARLASGLASAASLAARASVSVSESASTSVVVDGTILDANIIIETGKIIVDPLVFDLNGDGLDLKGAAEGVDFDMNGDGDQSRMGFIRGDDALLFLDTYGDGLVRDGTQLFGNQNGYANGFEMLRAYDENGDGVIDENDAIFDQLRLWVENNENGVCEEGETISLREAGITSINLGYSDERVDDGKGNIVGQHGSFTRSDGSAGYVADVWFHELAMRPEGY